MSNFIEISKFEKCNQVNKINTKHLVKVLLYTSFDEQLCYV